MYSLLSSLWVDPFTPQRTLYSVDSVSFENVTLRSPIPSPPAFSEVFVDLATRARANRYEGYETALAIASCAGIATAGAVGVWFARIWADSANADDFRLRVRSAITRMFGRSLRSDTRQEIQRLLEVADRQSPPNHPHGKAAGLRTGASQAIDAFANGSGYQVYPVGTSSRESTAGYHQIYSARDALFPAVRSPVLATSLLKFIDTDYHQDMSYWANFLRPMLLYTFAPTTVAGTVEDGHFTIENDTVQYSVNGGAEYRHQIWDYSTDWLVFDKWWGAIVCTTEHRMVADTRRIVAIIPEYVVYGPIAWILPGRRLRRVKYSIAPGINRIDTTDEEGKRWVSLGRAGKFTSVQLPYDLLEAITIRFRESKKAEIFSVERYISLFREIFPMPSITAALLYDVLTVVKGELQPGMLQTRGGKQPLRPTGYQLTGPPRDGYFVTEDGKDIGRAVGVSITDDPAVTPKESFNNDLACIVGRIERVYNQVVPPAVYCRYAAEFARLVVPDDIAGTGVLWSEEQVLGTQTRPTQIAKNQKAMPWLTHYLDVVIDAFMKHEWYGKVADPRNISAVSAQHNLRLAAYVYPFCLTVMKNYDWYMPGKSPTEIAKCVTTYCRQFDVVSETDYSRWDGTVSIWMRCYLERAIFLRWVHPNHKREIASLFDAEVGARGRSKYGMPYKPLGTRLSGSLLTSVGNTLDNAGLMYCAARKAGCTIQEAWGLIGPVCGDDGITGLAPVAMELSSVDVGVKLKCIARQRGDHLMFLGRLFLDPWTVDASVQDPPRTLRKLHLSHASKDVPNHVAAYYRATGYLALDPTAPITSAWCQRILDQLSRDSPGVAADAVQFRELVRCDVPYFVSGPNETTGGTWPQSSPDSPLLWQRVAEALGVDSAQVRAWHDLVRLAGTDEEITGLISLSKDAPVPGAIIDDGDFLHHPGTPDPRPRLPTAGVVKSRYGAMCDAQEQQSGRPETSPTPVRADTQRPPRDSPSHRRAGATGSKVRTAKPRVVVAAKHLKGKRLPGRE